ncbi:phosphoribosylglycinamide formyltransferase [Sneathiella chungangensis]|uniref:Phosphoribosylglycinamide formyltransferase n=1 Tax=Sneathiella chungangensis TaxID=1418234 RepID=A0A845M9W2_9PROT|nr:phosphoribosylglycinamide formyltransferase [Sneathiella chungangensis]MZR20831.1 phosphoribosylglycinamide formyltransferase [Sneathiella chungangensis]
MAKLKVAVFISSRGTNMQSLVKACRAPDFPAEICCVLSNNLEAAGLKFAAENSIPTRTIDHRDFESREAFEAEITSYLEDLSIDLICLAGFMRLLTAEFVNRWRDRILNIHPSLLPAFKGLHVHERAIESGARFAGCTVHFVRPEMDNGPIIAQAVVPILEADTADSLAARILEQEHRIYPLSLRLVAENRVKIHGSRVLIERAEEETGALINPKLENF